MPLLYFDRWYIILIIPTMLLALLAQARVKATFARWSKVNSRSGITGREVAQRILAEGGVHNVQIQPVAGQLTDNYNPKDLTLNLSEPVYNSPSVAAIGVAAHESGHALQYAKNYSPVGVRQWLYPAANIGSMAGPYIAILGLFLNSDPLFTIGILAFAVAVAFYLLTLPVEINASRRAIQILDQDNILTGEELAGARSVLRAAALTYVASAATAVASLLRLVLIARDRDR